MFGLSLVFDTMEALYSGYLSAPQWQGLLAAVKVARVRQVDTFFIGKG